MKLLFFIEITAIVWFALVGGPTQATIQHGLGVDDHAMHVAAFLVMSSTALLVWTPASVIPVLMGVAASIELAQTYVPGRQSSAIDFLASGAGIFAAILLARFVWPRFLLTVAPRLIRHEDMVRSAPEDYVPVRLPDHDGDEMGRLVLKQDRMLMLAPNSARRVGLSNSYE